MATPDIREKLVQKSMTSVTQAAPVEKNQFLPDIPPAELNASLPVEVINALEGKYKATKTSLSSERRRIDETANALKTANLEIDSAVTQIQEADSSLGLNLLGIFDKNYNKEFQRNRIRKAQRSLTIKGRELDLERQKEALLLKEQALPADMFIQQLEIKGKLANLSAMQANAIIQSNTARKQYREQVQLSYTDEQIEGMYKSGTYDNVWTAQDVKKYRDDKAQFKMDMDTKTVALKSNRLKLAENIEIRALAQLPISYGKSLLDEAAKTNAAVINLGSGVAVATSTLQKTVAMKMKQQNEDYATTSEAQLKLVKNDGEMSSMLSNVVNSSAIHTGNGQELANLPQLNLLNITEDTVKDFPIESIHPNLRPGFQTVLSAAAILNEKSQPTRDAKGKILKQAEGVTTQDVFTFKQTVNDLNAEALNLQKATIETAEDKGSKAAYKEWFTNGSMQTQDNSAAMLVSNIISQPNLGDDHALQAAYSVLSENVATEVGGGEAVNFADLAPEERTNLIFKSISESGFKGKISSRDKIMRAIRAKNGNKITPLQAYSNNRIAEVMQAGMKKLGEKYPEYQGYFESLKRETQFKNPSKLAGSLAELSFRVKRQKPDTPEMFLNNELLEHINQYMKSNSTTWDAQLNPVRGSFTNLLFNTKPSIYIDGILNTAFGTPSRNAWTTLSGPTFTEQRKENQRQYEQFLQSEPTIRPEANVFGDIPLPIK